jgi:hypothetical protein
MKYQKSMKELVFSAKFEVSEYVISKIEEMRMFGNATRVDSPFLRTDNDPVRISVYRPGEFRPGLTGLRLLKKSLKGGEYWKIVLIPNPARADEMPEMPEASVFQCLQDHIGFCDEERRKWIGEEM